MNYSLRILITVIFLLPLVACDRANNKGGDGANRGKELIVQKLCNSRKQCLSGMQKDEIRKLSIMRFERFYRSLNKDLLMEDNLIRLQAIGLEEAYKEYFNQELSKESSEYIIELYQQIFEKDHL